MLSDLLVDITESLFDNGPDGECACGNQADAGRGVRAICGPWGRPRVRDAAGTASAARATAAGRAGSRVGAGRSGVRPAVPGARGRGVGGRGVVRDRGDTRGRSARGRRPRPGRRADPAGPGSRPSLAAGGGVAARRVRACPAAPARASPGSGQAAPRGDVAARAGRPAGDRGLARGAGAAAGRHPAVDRAGGRARPTAGVLRGGGGKRPRGGGDDAHALALAARRERRRRRGRPARPPGGLPVRRPGGPALHPGLARPAGSEQRVSARRPAAGRSGARRPGADQPPPRIMVVSCPGLCCPDGRPRDPGDFGDFGDSGDFGHLEAARLLERVIAVVTGFCPKVEVVEPGVCAFGARGPARYFGGETALAARIIAAVADLVVESRVGVADGLFAALLAARGASPASAASPGRAADSSSAILVVPPGGTAQFLAAQPVSVLADQDLAGLLKRLGLGKLGEFAALPARDVASRFGDAGEYAHRLARGLDPRSLAARPPPADLSVAQEFDPPESRAEPVVFAAKALAEQLHAGLAARGLICVRVLVRATWADGRESSRLWRHDGLLSAAGVADRVRWQLDGWRPTPGDGAPSDREADAGQHPEGGIAVLRLSPDLLVRAAGQQLALWGETVVSDRVARAAMRVQAMLGQEAVLRPVLGGGRDFAGQVTPVPFGEKREPRLAADQPWPGRVIGPAPGVVYPAAREAEVTDDAGEIVTVSGRCVLSAAPARLAVPGEPPRRVTGWAGPWPLSERWWDPAAARRRARFQLATDDGRAWLAVVQDGRWLIEAGYW